jgi:hypothetical protein
MPFTPITLTGGPFTRPDGTPAAGRLTVVLSAPMRNGSAQVDPTPLYGTLNAAGLLKDWSAAGPLVLEANDDPGTVPSAPTASYEFSLELDGAPGLPFSAVISHSALGGTVDLSALMP